MAFPQFGYHGIGPQGLPVPPNQSSLLLAAASTVNPASSGASSRQTEAPSRDAPASAAPSSSTAQCPCYPPGLLASYPRMPGGLSDANPAAAAAAATAALYGGAYPPGYLPISAGEAVMNSMCGDLKSASELSGLIPGSHYFPAYELAGFPYHNGFALDPNARRKNATRESTTTLKAWLNEHRKNPYPTKGEKIMLAIITKMTLTQVSTWFANARRRLKKDNKVTWSPRNRGEDDDDDDEDETNKEAKDEEFDVDIENDDEIDDSPLPRSLKEEVSPLRIPSPPPVAYSTHSAFTPINLLRSPPKQPTRTNTDSLQNNRSTKIWSLAEVASSKDPKTEGDTPAFVTRGPTQQTFPQKAPTGFSAFRPLLHGVPPQSLSGPLPWPPSPSGAPHHPAYSYALSQHYLAMSMARPGFIPANLHPTQKHTGGPQDMKSSSPDSSRSATPDSPPMSPFRPPHRPQATSSLSSSSSLPRATSTSE